MNFVKVGRSIGVEGERDFKAFNAVSMPLGEVHNVHKVHNNSTVMKKASTKILSLFARGREIGFVLMDQRDVLRYGVKTIKGTLKERTLAKRIEKALSPLFESLGPRGWVVLERRANNSTQGALCRTIIRLAEHWQERTYRVRFLALTEVKGKLCGDQKVTHDRLKKAVVARYPLFQPWSDCPTMEQTKYWGKMLIAVGLADCVV